MTKTGIAWMSAAALYAAVALPVLVFALAQLAS
jgi:hypothetical protein